MVNRCKICGKEVSMPFKCKHCGGTHCNNHYIPEFHNCPHQFPRDVYRKSLKNEIDWTKMSMGVALTLHGATYVVRK